MSSEEQSSEEIIPAGHILGERYEIKDLLGSGGMANVYSAYDKIFRTEVALKLLNKRFFLPNLNENEYQKKYEEYIHRFYREAQAAALLNHKNITRIFDVKELEGMHCISMELIKGKTLDRIMEEYFSEQKTFFPIIEACALISQVTDALSYAHGQGIIHRDINPRNIIVREGKEVKVTDFGIVKIMERSAESSLTKLTLDLSIMGTPQYMSPEQIRQGELTGKTDVFSTGVVLYELLTASLPFDNVKETPITIQISNILNKKLKEPRAINRKIPQSLENIILKALDKEQGKRYDAQGLYAALDLFLKGEKVEVQGSFKRRFDLNRREFLIKGSAAAIGLAATIGTPTFLIIKNNEYEKSLYSTLDKIQEAENWEEMKPYLKELEIKLFDWVLERSKDLRKDAAPLLFKDNKTVEYTNNSYHGFQFIRDIYALGFQETGNPEFLKLFTHFYDLTEFNKTQTYQFYLDRFKIDYKMIKLLEEIGFNKLSEYKEKMKAAIQHLITERYHKRSGFFQYITKNDEVTDEQIVYARTQYNTIPLLIEGFKIFDVRKDFMIKTSEYAAFLIKQTHLSNTTLIGRDSGVYFGAFIYPLSKASPKFFFKTGNSDKAYLSEDIVRYIKNGLWPLVELYDLITEIKNSSKLEASPALHKNILDLEPSDFEVIQKEKEAAQDVLIKMVGFYREHLSDDGWARYYIPITGQEFRENNPLSLKSTAYYATFLGPLGERTNIFPGYFNKEKINQLLTERVRIIKSVCRRNNFNKRYVADSYQSFLSNVIYDITDPTIVSDVETEEEIIKMLAIKI